MSRTRLLRQLAQWRNELPNIVPHYAVKSNNDRQLLKWLLAEGSSFDCASPREIHQVLRIGARPDQIIYANPCKSHDDIRTAMQLGISTTVVDSPEEVQKLLEAGYGGDKAHPRNILIRLKVPDAASAQPFSRKFGAPFNWIPDILDIIRSRPGIHHAGWSFHVGSLCNQPRQFRSAIEHCALADAIATDCGGNPASIVDIGGGFIPDPELFADAAAEIRDSQCLFPKTTRWIGEPGRFLSSPVATLHVSVIGVKRRADGGHIYTIDDSVYSSFSNIPFDGQKPVYELLAADAASRPRVKATLFGRTCDSADCLADNIELPQLRVGDVLQVRNMGAYTSVSASFFNGFDPARREYQT